MAERVPQIPIPRPHRRRNMVIGVCVLLVALAGTTLLIDFNPYVGGVAQQFAIIDHDHTVSSGSLETEEQGPAQITVSFESLDYRNLHTGRRVRIAKMYFGRIKLGVRVTVRSKENQITHRFFVSRWTRDPVTCDAGDQLKVIVQDIRLPPAGEIGK